MGLRGERIAKEEHGRDLTLRHAPADDQVASFRPVDHSLDRQP